MEQGREYKRKAPVWFAASRGDLVAVLNREVLPAAKRTITVYHLTEFRSTEKPPPRFRSLLNFGAYVHRGVFAGDAYGLA